MKTWRVATVLAVALSVSWTLPANSQVGLYDDFSSGVLDPARWMGYEFKYDTGGIDRDNAHIKINEVNVRRVIDGQAQIALTSYLRDLYRDAFPYDPSRVGPIGRSGLRINHPVLADGNPRVRTLRATVTVANVLVQDDLPGQDCGAFRSGRAGAQIFGHFLNNGVTSDPDDFRGDVFAVLALDRRVMRSESGSAGVQNVMEAWIGHCDNRDCSSFTPLGNPHLLPRQWTTGVPYVLTIAWRPSTTTFLFAVAGGGFSDSHVISYLTPSGPPRAYAYELRAETRPTHCRDDRGVIVGRRMSIDARFDNVYLNIGAADAVAAP
jgi:hypothetical protein